MTSTPQYVDYSIPPSPNFPPVPCVSRASSASSLNSLYNSDGERLPPSSYDYENNNDEVAEQTYYSMSKSASQVFTEDDLVKAFNERNESSSTRSTNGTRLVHDVSDPQSPWKRSIRLRYSDVNMRDSNAMALQEASNMLSQDMSNYVCIPSPSLFGFAKLIVVGKL